MRQRRPHCHGSAGPEGDRNLARAGEGLAVQPELRPHLDRGDVDHERTDGLAPAARKESRLRGELPDAIEMIEVRVRQQDELLRPIAEAGQRYHVKLEELLQSKKRLDAASLYFASETNNLLTPLCDKWQQQIHFLIDDIARLEKMKARSPEAREKLNALIGYYTDHQSRMCYDEYLRKGYGIGSGAVESAHKQIVHARLRQSGMRFSERGAIHLLALRVLLLNGQWSLLDRLVMRPLAA